MSVADQFLGQPTNDTRMKRKAPNPSRYDLGGRIRGVSDLNVCGEKCIEAGDACKAIEYHPIKGLCILKNLAPTLRLQKPVNHWKQGATSRIVIV